MINITNKNQCCGCSACVSICGHNCIKMQEDAEGFWYPIADANLCVNCGLCEKVCPMIHPESDLNILKVIGAKHTDDSIRRASSSGGLFTSFAKAILDNGGIVVGCAMNHNLQAVHIIVNTPEDLAKLRSSKYVQSNLENIFSQVRQKLQQGIKVLFSGTPCQVAGLRRFLRRNYDNLFCIDVLCHGVPSPKLFSQYKDMMERKYQSKAVFVSFRCKKHQWKRLHIDMKFENGKEYYKSATFDPYMQAFLGNLSQRPSCFNCPFNSTNRQGDISLGDFWGIGKKYPELDDDKGISMILINSEKGMDIYEAIKEDITVYNSTLQLAIEGNQVLIEHISGESNRDAFYNTFSNDGITSAFAKHTIHYPQWKQYYITGMRWCVDILRKITRKGY